ncbi:LysR family transcriptional regulator [Chryseobacterium sp. MYb264]|uniref:LysR family transcriptional regulator n=1 Tax=Chryseobacterium sp. MYb264 TaxID=2745153 RepID=UPI002E164E83|nr:LysR family transcriptional regulator [Chryseobacterium sp. MYb264]
MDLHQLKYFLALAKELHFWNTAAKMNITQSALSRQIQALENELDVQLFYRDKRNVKLTPAGKFLQEQWALEINQLESVHQMAKQIHLGAYGKIRMAHPDSISSSILPDFLEKVLDHYPHLELELIQLPYENQDEYLLNYKIDFAFTRDINHSLSINSRLISSEKLTLVVPWDHPLSSPEDISSQSIENERFILTVNDYESSYNRHIREVFSFYNISQKSYIMSEFGSTIISLVKKGLGISILPKSYAKNGNTGVKFIDLPFETNLFVIWRKNDPNPIVNNLLKLI